MILRLVLPLADHGPSGHGQVVGPKAYRKAVVRFSEPKQVVG